MQYTGALPSCQWLRTEALANLMAPGCLTSLLLRPSLWLTLPALSGAQFRLTSRRVKREAGENAWRSIPALPPQR